MHSTRKTTGQYRNSITDIIYLFKRGEEGFLPEIGFIFLYPNIAG